MLKMGLKVPHCGAAMPVAEIGEKMERDWEALQKNINKIVKKEVSIDQIKNIVAIISIMESVGMEFDKDQKIKSDMLRDMMVSGMISKEQFITMTKPTYYNEYEKVKYYVDKYNHMDKTLKVCIEINRETVYDSTPGKLAEFISENLIHQVLKEVYKTTSAHR